SFMQFVRTGSYFGTAILGGAKAPTAGSARSKSAPVGVPLPGWRLGQTIAFTLRRQTGHFIGTDTIELITDLRSGTVRPKSVQVGSRTRTFGWPAADSSTVAIQTESCGCGVIMDIAPDAQIGATHKRWEPGGIRESAKYS